MKRYIFILICILISFRVCFAGNETQEADSRTELFDGWYYQWGDIIEDSTGSPDWGAMDDGWRELDRRYQIEDRNNRNFMVLKKKMPDIYYEDAVLFITGILSSAEVYLENEKIYTFGNFYKDEHSRYQAGKWHIINLPENYPGKIMHVRIFSDDPDYIGIPMVGDNTIFLSSETGALRFLIFNSIDRFVLGCIFILIGIISVDIFFHRWKLKSYYYLSFAIFSISIGMMFVTMGELYQLLWEDYIFQFNLATIGLLIFPVGFFSFYEQVIKKNNRKKIFKIIWIFFLAYALILVPLQIFGVIDFRVLYYGIWSILLTISFIVTIILSIMEAIEGNKDSRFLSLGFVLMMLFVVHDFLFLYGVIPYWRWMAQWGVLLFLLSLSHIIERRNMLDRNKIIKYSEQLEDYSTSLEKRVEERTRDLSEKNMQLEKTMDALKVAQQQLVTREKIVSLGHLVAGVAHEMNNPMGALKSSSDVIDRCVKKIIHLFAEKKDRKIQPIVTIMEDSVRVMNDSMVRLSGTVKTLKSFAHLDESEFKSIDINKSINDTLSLLSTRTDENIKIIKNFGDIPPVQCYPNQLNQVFLNIIVNALEAMDGDGTLEITTRLYDWGEASEDQQEQHTIIAIEISDDGIGIPEENLEKIYDPGFTTKGAGVGTGLGLSSSYKIIENHGGKIVAESHVDIGTTFRIELPVHLRHSQ